MRRRLTLLAALAVLTACSQKDQSLPFQPEPSKPVTRTMGSGSTTVSSPDGISITLPAGALPAGTPITVAKLNQSVTESVPGAVGDAFLLGFGAAPSSDPSLSISFVLSGNVTAGHLVGMVPVVLSVGAYGGAPAGNLGVSKLVSHPMAGGVASSTTAGDQLDGLLKEGVLTSLLGDAAIHDISRGELNAIIQRIQGKATDSPTSWYSDLYSLESVDWVSSLKSRIVDVHIVDPSKRIPLTFDDPEYQDAFSQYMSGDGHAYLITNVDPTVLPANGMTDFPSNDESSYPLIPDGSTSATFTLACTGMQWPGADDVPLCSEKSIDVRVGSELLERYPASVIVPNYLLGEMTLGADGSASGRVEYEVYLRSALSSGITGTGRKGSYDLSGSWSVRGDTITIGGHDFLYTTPDDSTLILGVSDSVKVHDNDGSESWEPVRVDVKLLRK